MRYFYSIIGLTFLLTSCFDLYEQRNDLFDNYYIANDPAIACKTLYYKGEAGYEFERIRCVEKVGKVASFIIVQSGDKFQYLNTLKEKSSDIGDKEVKNNISRLLSKEEFQYFLDSLSIKDFKFKYEK